MDQHFPNLPDLVPQRGTALSRALFKNFLAQGWTIEGEVLICQKQWRLFPHTSNIDGWYGFLAIFGLGIQITVLGKDALLNHHLNEL